MHTLILIILGLCFGSFVNAAVWRLHEQSKPKKSRAASDRELSIAIGHSMCPHCKHRLSHLDMVPVLSWVFLKGKCRYCKHPIEDTPLPELLLPLAFVISYLYWPFGFEPAGQIIFALWLVALVVFAVLFIYDLKWMILPDRLTYLLCGVGVVNIMVQIILLNKGSGLILQALLAVVVSGGIFFGLYQISKGTWIGGGDVKLGYAIGLLLSDPLKSFMVLFISSILGVIIALPLLAMGKSKLTSHLPYGPFLILATMIVYLFGSDIYSWYSQLFV